MSKSLIIQRFILFCFAGGSKDEGDRGKTKLTRASWIGQGRAGFHYL